MGNSNMRVTQDEAERRKVHEYRAGVREWVYAYARREGDLGRWPRLVTFTLKDTFIFGSVVSHDDPEWLLSRMREACAETNLRGFACVEAGRRTGRLHGHSLLWGDLQVVADRWRARRGFAVVSDVSDLLGAVHYVTKALGPESKFAMVDGRETQEEFPW